MSNITTNSTARSNPSATTSSLQRPNYNSNYVRSSHDSNTQNSTSSSSSAKSNKSKSKARRKYSSKMSARPLLKLLKKATFEEIDYKNIAYLSTVLINGRIPTGTAKGVCGKKRKFAEAIKRARALALAPYSVHATS